MTAFLEKERVIQAVQAGAVETALESIRGWDEQDKNAVLARESDEFIRLLKTAKL